MEDLDRAPVEAAIARRTPLKARSDFNNYSVWKHKLRENCYRRVQEDRGRLLWRMRLPDSKPCTSKELIKSAFRDIVSDELKKIKSTSVTDSLKIMHGAHEPDDILWEYDGLHQVSFISGELGTPSRIEFLPLVDAVIQTVRVTVKHYFEGCRDF